MAPRTYEDVLARNVAALRTRARLNQAVVAARMRELGYTAWLRQTVANVENGKRRLTGGEIHALAWVLETNLLALLKPTEDDGVIEFPSGLPIGVVSVGRSIGGFNDRAVVWPEGGDKPVIHVLTNMPNVDVNAPMWTEEPPDEQA
ncbi:MAG TPA: helix-turn-helix transcriptional regulator [Streptosporangiaceae bacterium]|nr:helix-turn-helix transcriptional regulator [Streptosporangiaceae bacterium]